MRLTLLNQRFSTSELWRLRSSLMPTACSPRKMANLFSLMRSRAAGAVTLCAGPAILMVEASSCCDMHCPMCPVIMEGTRRNKGHMPLEGYRKVLGEVGDTTMAICFWNFGEPLLNSSIFQMIRDAKARRIFTAVSSNLLSLDGHEKQDALLDSELDYLIVSFDGASAQTYEKYRGAGNFERVLGNLRGLLRRRREQRRRTPFINLQFVIMRDNEHEVEAVRSLGRELGVDKVSLKKFTYIGTGAADFLPSNPAYLLGKHKGEKRMARCVRPWESAVILWDGTVLPCCGDLRFTSRFGNAFGPHTFRAIWNSERFVSFRQAVLTDINSIPMCISCPSTDFTTDMFVQ